MTIEKVRCDGFSEINLDAFNRQQEITRIYVRKDEKYVLEEQPGMMDWSIDKKREVALDLIDSKYISYLALASSRKNLLLFLFCGCCNPCGETFFEERHLIGIFAVVSLYSIVDGLSIIGICNLYNAFIACSGNGRISNRLQLFSIVAFVQI